MRIKRSRPRGVVVSGLLVAAVAGLGACGSGGGGSGSSSAAAAGGGGGGVVSGGVVEVGLIDPVSGVLPFPSVAVGARAAANYVNKSLGGIGGHQVQIVSCNTDGTPETNVSCANGFVQDKVSFVIDGFDLSSGSELPVLDSAKIPTIGSIADNTTANLSKTSFYFGPASQAFSVGPLYVLHKEGVKAVAFAAPDDATDQAYFNLDILPVGRQLGMSVSVVYYPASTGANWQVIAASLEAKKPQLAGLAAGMPSAAFDALAERVRILVDQPWDAAVMPPGSDCRRREMSAGHFRSRTW